MAHHSSTFSILSFPVYAPLFLVLLLSQVSQPLKSSFNEGLFEEYPTNASTLLSAESCTSKVVELRPNQNHNISILRTSTRPWKFIMYSLENKISKTPQNLECHNGTGSCVQLTLNAKDNPEDWDGSLREGLQQVLLTNWGTLDATIFATIYYEPADSQTCASSSGTSKELNCTYMVIKCTTGGGEIPIQPDDNKVTFSRSNHDSTFEKESGVFASFTRWTFSSARHSYEDPKNASRRCIPFDHGTDGYSQSCGSISSIDEKDELYSPKKYCEVTWLYLMVRSIGSVVFVMIPTVVIFLLFYRRQMAQYRQRLERDAEEARARNRSVTLIDLAHRYAEDIPPSYDDVYETKDPPPCFCQAVGIIESCDPHKYEPNLDELSEKRLAEASTSDPARLVTTTQCCCKKP